MWADVGVSEVGGASNVRSKVIAKERVGGLTARAVVGIKMSGSRCVGDCRCTVERGGGTRRRGRVKVTRGRETVAHRRGKMELFNNEFPCPFCSDVTVPVGLVGGNGSGQAVLPHIWLIIVRRRDVRVIFTVAGRRRGFVSRRVSLVSSIQSRRCVMV